MAIIFIAPTAVASSFVTFNTTTAFDAGTKSNIDTKSNSVCLVASNTFQMNATSGFFGINACLISGSPYISVDSIKLSYDMQTLSSGKMKDFSGSGKDGTITGTTVIAGKFGSARNFAGAPDNIVTSGPVSTATNNFAMSAWIYPTTIPSQEMAYFNGLGAANGYGFGIGDGVGGAGSKIVYLIGGVAWKSSGVTAIANTWYHIILERNAGTFTIYINGTAQGATSASNPNTPLTQTTIGLDPGNGNFHGIIDEVLFFNRTLTPSEKTIIATVGGYRTTGVWKSAVQTYNGEIPKQITVDWNNISANNYIQGISILGSFGVAFNNTTIFNSGSLISIPITFSTTLEDNWRIQIVLKGNGTTTVVITSIIVLTGSIPLTNTPNLDATTITLILLILAFIVLLIIGFFERFAMVGAAIVCAIIAVLGWTWTGAIYVPAIFILLMAVCIGLAATRKVSTS